MKKKSALTISDKIMITIFVVTALFVILKLTSVLQWSWWLVFSPVWIPVALLFIVLIAWQLFNVIDALMDKEVNR